MATNFQMISEMADMIGYEYDGENLKTFAEWEKEGMIVKKGQKAFMVVDLWRPFKKKIQEEGKPVIDPETGEQKEEKRFTLKTCHLFTPDQVEKGERKKKPAKKKKPAAKKKKIA